MPPPNWNNLSIVYAKAAAYFDQAAATWDDNPRRIAQMKAIGEAMLREAKPTKTMDVLDYGCGTGLLGLFLLPHVRSVTGADNSAGMLDMLSKKIRDGAIENMKATRLDLEHDPLPQDRFDLIVTSMVLHHTADTSKVLAAFHGLLHPQGTLCIADLDTEPGVFHDAVAAVTVHHLGFDRREFRAQLVRAGFGDVRDITAHTIRKPVEAGGERDFPVFLMTAKK